MDDDFWDQLTARIGEPIECDLCRTPTLRRDLREAVAPGVVIAEWDMVVDRVVWLCMRCPG